MCPHSINIIVQTCNETDYAVLSYENERTHLFLKARPRRVRQVRGASRGWRSAFNKLGHEKMKLPIYFSVQEYGKTQIDLKISEQDAPMIQSTFMISNKKEITKI